ncbi:helix-turn-helix transcriptional regulator [Mycobacterium shinjukuense]|uniref:helix-turn-helix domain-containing protein n=1 Tax=Mycobacterium shinjukuense TaxID=398694 RepID=UPI00310148E2
MRIRLPAGAPHPCRRRRRRREPLHDPPRRTTDRARPPQPAACVPRRPARRAALAGSGGPCGSAGPGGTPRQRAGVSADRIRALRERAAWTPAQLAHATGIAQPHPSAYESGARTVTPQVLDRIEEATRVRRIALPRRRS